MKKLKILLVALLIMPFTIMAQKGPFDDLFDKYSEAEDVTSISISMDGFKIIVGGDNEATEFFELMDQVDKVKVLNFDNHYKSFKNSDFLKEVNAIIKKNDYKQLADIKSQDENVSIYIIQDEDGMVKEGLIIAREDDDATIISVRGNMNPSDFLSMHHHMNKHKRWKHY